MSMEVLAKIFWIGLGGVLGANARYWLGEWVTARAGAAFPWATFLINVSGSFLLGVFLAVTAERATTDSPPHLHLFFAVGFLGAYTTFSTFAFETYTLASTGGLTRAFANALGSLLAGFAGVWLGMLLGKAFAR